MLSNKLKLYYNTLKFMKPLQVSYQLYYRLLSKLGISEFSNKLDIKHEPLHFIKAIYSSPSYPIEMNSFTFLNQTKTFLQTIDWNFTDYGKLWTYNLNYFDFLEQEGLSKEIGLNLIHDFCSKGNTHIEAYEPYPISLRVVNWVKFLSRHQVFDDTINHQLIQDLYRLKGKIEYHIMANHLFENGFGLLFGAYFFQDEKLYRSAKDIILSQLQEQILSDGAHYELSPMYHNIILLRILDSYQLVSRNNWKVNELSKEFIEAAALMLGWMNTMSFSNGEMPCLNDSTSDIAPRPQEINDYAKLLGIELTNSKLSSCGYRKYHSNGLELIFDCGQIAPRYQPGHSHADSLQILLYEHGIPVIVDTGISTYEKNERRHLERSTSSHNTVTVDGKNSSEVWSGFRVGRRAVVNIQKENFNSITAEHNGYRNFEITHQRTIEKSSNGYKISDNILGPAKNRIIQGHLHFHPETLIVISDNLIQINNKVQVKFNFVEDLLVQNYKFAEGFNLLRDGKKIIYTFKQSCCFEINRIV